MTETALADIYPTLHPPMVSEKNSRTTDNP